MAMAISQLLLRRSPACRSLLGLALRSPSPHIVSPSLPPFRLLAIAAAADHELLRTLKDEIEHERQADTVSRREVKDPPKPFTIDDKPGAQQVFFYRSYNNEDVKVASVFHTQSYPQMDDDDGQESEDTTTRPMVQMNVTVSKRGDDPYLEIQCVTYGDEPVIDRVCYKEVATGVKDLPYEGPQYSDLDVNVQAGFQKYLTARGIDADFCSYLQAYMYHKEQREYSRWLRNVEGFITK